MKNTSKTDQGKQVENHASTASLDLNSYIERMREIFEAKDISLEYFSDVCSALENTSGAEIRMIKDSCPIRELCDLLHRFAETILGWSDYGAYTQKTIREIEVEAVAFAVIKALGLHTDAAASDYFGQSHGSIESLEASMHTTLSLSAKIVASITAHDK